MSICRFVHSRRFGRWNQNSYESSAGPNDHLPCTRKGQVDSRYRTFDLAYKVRTAYFVQIHSLAKFVARTAIWVAEQLTDAKFDVHEEADSRVLIQCDGIGYAPLGGDLSAVGGTDEPNVHE